ncbi:MAG: hypothetical protein Q7U04_12535 [Bacteriovorax sp.]|nr:hypothetical protein [Bacteriovorax sp.]
MISFIGEVFLSYLLTFPGAFLQWLFFRKGRSLKQIHKDDLYLNYVLGGIFLTLLGIGIYFIAA